MSGQTPINNFSANKIADFGDSNVGHLLERTAFLWDKIARDPDEMAAAIFMISLCDIWSAYCWMARARRGHGSSGVIGIALYLNVLLVLFSREAIFIRQTPIIVFKLLDISILTFFHLLCQFAVPGIYTRWLTSQKSIKH